MTVFLEADAEVLASQFANTNNYPSRVKLLIWSFRTVPFDTFLMNKTAVHDGIPPLVYNAMGKILGFLKGEIKHFQTIVV